MTVKRLYGKLILKGKIQVKTGMHIGGSSDFSGIGAVDSVVIKDTVTKLPMIPGSTLKGKMRYLLARVYSDTPELVDISKEAMEIKRLFGTTVAADGPLGSRLQFSDMLMTMESRDKIVNMEPDLYVTEIKFENTINRLTSVANPRQIERVPSGAEFEFNLVYNIEDLEEVEEDLRNIRTAMELLEDDYIGGHGTRGYGRIEFNELDYELKSYSDFNKETVESAAKEILKN
jgi:CRISPR-associated protein Csm3